MEFTTKIQWGTIGHNTQQQVYMLLYGECREIQNERKQKYDVCSTCSTMDI